MLIVSFFIKKNYICRLIKNTNYYEKCKIRPSIGFEFSINYWL